MDIFSEKLNTLLVETFHTILKFEEEGIKRMGVADLTITELHMLEAVWKKGNRCTISDIASQLNITPASVTVAVNKLEKKKYVEKERCTADGRVVFVALTKLGRKMNSAHRYFHEQMVRAASKELNEEEREVLCKGIDNLNRFFEKQLLKES